VDRPPVCHMGHPGSNLHHAKFLQPSMTLSRPICTLLNSEHRVKKNHNLRSGFANLGTEFFGLRTGLRT
jgi:hypothetical protein